MTIYPDVQLVVAEALKAWDTGGVIRLNHKHALLRLTATF